MYDRGRPPTIWHSLDVASHGPYRNVAMGAAFAWPTSNLAIYVPVVVESRIVIRKMWYSNWTTAVGNYDIGLYDAAGTRLLSRGSTAKISSSNQVIWDCTDTTVGPGLYYLALVMSSASDQVLGATPSAPIATACGLLTEASALPLPATATFGLTQTLAVLPTIGLYTSTVPT